MSKSSLDAMVKSSSRGAIKLLAWARLHVGKIANIIIWPVKVTIVHITLLLRDTSSFMNTKYK